MCVYIVFVRVCNQSYFDLQARNSLNEKLKRMIEKRKESEENGEGLLGALLSKEEGKTKLSESQIADNIIGVIFAAHDTTASVLTWLLKYLHDNPHILDAVRVKFFFPYYANSSGKKTTAISCIDLFILLTIDF